MTRALVALKESRETARLAAAAAAIADPGAEVDVVHVLETDSGREVAEADVADAVVLLGARGCRARGHVDAIGEGGVAGRLAERARASGAEAIVMGCRGLSQVQGLVGHSISHALLASLDLPILVLPDHAPAPSHGFRRILAAVRTESDALSAVAAVKLLRGPLEVLAVHVPRRVALHVGEGAAQTFAEIGETSTAVLDAARGGFKKAGIRIAERTVDRDGGVAVAISDTARSWDADLIVLGPRRPSDWKALVAGSTSHSLLHRSELPVLIAGRPVYCT